MKQLLYYVLLIYISFYIIGVLFFMSKYSFIGVTIYCNATIYETIHVAIKSINSYVINSMHCLYLYFFITLLNICV